MHLPLFNGLIILLLCPHFNLFYVSLSFSLYLLSALLSCWEYSVSEPSMTYGDFSVRNFRLKSSHMI